MTSGRTVIVGANSRVWKRLASDPSLSHCVAIGHADVAGFRFEPSDVVWILSYSRNSADNRNLLETLKASGASHTVYVSTATANVLRQSRCYEYPRVKAESAETSRQLLGASVVSIGVVYGQLDELPAGTTMATSLSTLVSAIAAPPPSNDVLLFSPQSRRFGSALEAIAFRLYGGLQRICFGYPCLLRPLDLVLRSLGWRWYGYLYLSNRLWLTTTS